MPPTPNNKDYKSGFKEKMLMSKTMDIEAKERNTTVDFLKFVAIILVVVGHIMVSLYPENYNENLIFKICYSFHMPLFIFIGGG